jgi:hypothetical protein
VRAIQDLPFVKTGPQWPTIQFDSIYAVTREGTTRSHRPASPGRRVSVVDTRSLAYRAEGNEAVVALHARRPAKN